VSALLIICLHMSAISECVPRACWFVRIRKATTSGQGRGDPIQRITCRSSLWRLFSF
jgi:hypothetical protein